MYIITVGGVCHHGAAGKKDVILSSYRNGFLILDLNTVNRIAGLIHFQIIDCSVHTEGDPLILQPFMNRLDHRILVIAFCMQNALQIVEPVQKAESVEIPLRLQCTVIGLKSQHRVIAPPQRAMEELAVLSEIVLNRHILQILFRDAGEVLHFQEQLRTHAVVMHLFVNMSLFAQESAFGMDWHILIGSY